MGNDYPYMVYIACFIDKESKITGPGFVEVPYLNSRFSLTKRIPGQRISMNFIYNLNKTGTIESEY